MAVWYDVLIHLRDYLRAYKTNPGDADPLLIGVKIEAGALEPKNFMAQLSTGMICIIRDREPDEKLYKGGEGICDLLVDCWTREDDPDPAKGYLKLSTLEDKFKTALTNWATIGTRPASVIGSDINQIEIVETLGDLDSVRPVIGSRCKIRVTWSKRTI